MPSEVNMTTVVAAETVPTINSNNVNKNVEICDITTSDDNDEEDVYSAPFGVHRTHRGHIDVDTDQMMVYNRYVYCNTNVMFIAICFIVHSHDPSLAPFSKI